MVPTHLYLNQIRTPTSSTETDVATDPTTDHKIERSLKPSYGNDVSRHNKILFLRKESGLTFTYQTRATTTTLKQQNTTLTPLTFDGGEGKNELQFIYSSRKVNASI